MAASAWYELAKAIDGRLIGDATLLALLGTADSGSIFDTFGKAAASGQYPYIVKRRDSIAPADGFRLNMDVVDFTVMTRVEVDVKYGSDTYMARMDLILKRIKGDWEEQAAGTAPTYGLDRWVPGALASTGYTATDCHRTLGPMTVQEDDVLAEAMSFRVWISKGAA